VGKLCIGSATTIVQVVTFRAILNHPQADGRHLQRNCFHIVTQRDVLTILFQIYLANVYVVPFLRTELTLVGFIPDGMLSCSSRTQEFQQLYLEVSEQLSERKLVRSSGQALLIGNVQVFLKVTRLKRVVPTICAVLRVGDEFTFVLYYLV